MGLYASLYVGPYAVVTVKKHPTSTRVQACTRSACKKPKPTREFDAVREKFCSECGAKVDFITIFVEKAPSVFDILPDERLSVVYPEGGKQLYFILNEGREGIRQMNFDMGSHVDLLGIDREKEVADFTTRYQKELAALKQGYGDVQVTWGVQYWES